ncbi:Ankyrin repeat family protein [Euphorbia peplus]|nr:Ankyrin repeat family protein [Euphorbia peplus]
MISTGRSWFNYFQYDEKRDSPSEARNILLIIVSLISAVTFQAGVNPPGGVWQESDKGHIAGRAIYASNPVAYYVFVIANTLAFSTSVLVIISLTYKFPFHFEIWSASVSMLVTYGSAIFAVTPRESVHFRYLLFTAALPFVLRCFIQLFNKLFRS